MDDIVERLRRDKQPYVLATVVRTVAATAAKPGAKALITADGTVHGWVGGGCSQGAVRRAAKAALADGRARLISVRPEELLAAEGRKPGDAAEGIELHRSVCPSGGSLDIFIEPMLPAPFLVICGAAPVARALADLAPRIGFALCLAALADDLAGLPPADQRIEGFALPESAPERRFVVVATQGKRDLEALAAALATDAGYVAFVGSRRKIGILRERLRGNGIDPARLEAIRAPAGLDIGAVTPEEIALSILADVVKARRREAAATGDRAPVSDLG